MPNNRKIVQTMMAAYEKADIQTVLGMMSPDVVWFTPGDPATIPFSGTHNGRQGVGAYFALQAQIMKFTAFKPLGQMGAWNASPQVVLINETVLVNATQKTYEMDFALVISLSKGIVTHVEVLMDTQAVARAFAP